jgi:hypothetical protein
MRMVSALLRMLFGIAVMSTAWFVYSVHQSALGGAKPITVELFGNQFVAEPKMLAVGIGGAGFIGLILFLAGIYTALRKPAADVATERAKTGASPDGTVGT